MKNDEEWWSYHAHSSFQSREPDGDAQEGNSGKRPAKVGKSGKSGYFLPDLLIFTSNPLMFDMKIKKIQRETNDFL